MDTNNIIRFMGQQLKALKEIEDLLTHNDNQQLQNHGINPEAIEALKSYVATMKLAAGTAEKLAGHYKTAGSTQPSGAAPEPSANATGTEAEKPTRKRSSTKPETQETPKEDPPGEQPGENPDWEKFDFLG